MTSNIEASNQYMEGNHSTSREIHTPAKDTLENSSCIPKIGMEFDDEEIAYCFYNLYAQKQGFSVRRQSWCKNKQGVVIRKEFTCHKEGYAVKQIDGNRCKKRSEARCGCAAKMVIKRGENGKFVVSQFQATHNHPLATPSKISMLRSHRKITKVHSAGATPRQAAKYLGKQAGEYHNLSFLPMEHKNYLRTSRTMNPHFGDAGSVMQHLRDRATHDPSFFYSIQLDCDDAVTNFFWTDAKSRLDFECFGDVVVFDTTLKVNSEDRPFAIFMGVNHHKQAVVFGAAIMFDESTDSFEWVFETFKNAMRGHDPKVILTDEDQSMATALKKVWPSTHHRLCVWHLYQNALKHLGNEFIMKNGFKSDFADCIFNSDDDFGFLCAWRSMLEKYDLLGNEWLAKAFSNREKWALAYGREHFYADMISAQKNESMYNTLKKLLNPKLDLLLFLDRFDTLVEERRFAELDEDAKAKQTTPRMLFTNLLRESAMVYTPTVFELVREEATSSMDCNFEFLSEEVTISKYKVTAHRSMNEYLVSFDSLTCDVSCSCKKFEFCGILCRHAIKVLDIRKIKHIPEQYILKRWTKNAKSGLVQIHCTGTYCDDEKTRISTRHSLLSHSLMKLAASASENEETFQIVEKQQLLIMNEVENMLKRKNNEGTVMSWGDSPIQQTRSGHVESQEENGSNGSNIVETSREYGHSSPYGLIQSTHSAPTFTQSME